MGYILENLVYTDLEVRHSNTEESLISFIRKKHNLFWNSSILSNIRISPWLKLENYQLYTYLGFNQTTKTTSIFYFDPWLWPGITFFTNSFQIVNFFPVSTFLTYCEEKRWHNNVRKKGINKMKICVPAMLKAVII